MARTVRVEKRQRGVFGWLFLLLFWGFNVVMAVGFFGGMSDSVEQGAAITSEAEQAGFAIGTAIGFGMILTIWAFGAIILGLFVLFTRGKKTIIETTED